jgi:acetyl/propionyl-CoA carboxylase alpha subunit
VKYIVTLGDQRAAIDVAPDGVTIDGNQISASLSDLEGTPVRLVTIGDTVHRVILRRRVSRGHYVLWLDGFSYDVEALDERTRAIRDLSAAAAGPIGPQPLIAPMPGLVVRVEVQAGDEVCPGQGLVVMEAMKMENELRSTGAGRVKRVLVAPGEAVEKGSVLIEME